MNSKLTIVMYHYVRDLQHSRYPDIKGIDLHNFKEQILYLRNNYTFITIEQLIDSYNNKTSLPNKAVLLTFDDAYVDHFTNVFPILNENKIQGAFFPPIKAITKNKVLDVNKLHFILASCHDKNRVVEEIYSQLDRYRSEFSLKPNQYYYNKLAEPSRFDSGEIIFIKRLLQLELSESLRNKIVDHLFKLFVGINENSFSRELYMNTDQLKCMLRNGMHIGSHGYEHYWLNTLSKEQQENELILSKEFIKSIGGDEDYLTLCFPYGAFNSDTLTLMSKHNFKVGFSTKVDVAICSVKDKFHLPRLDTNDIPVNRAATTNSWYLKG